MDKNSDLYIEDVKTTSPDTKAKTEEVLMTMAALAHLGVHDPAPVPERRYSPPPKDKATKKRRAKNKHARKARRKNR